jgi:hypothetical protein
MRRCNIVSGILLILSIIDFALAAPVLVQEKRQASVDVVQIPEDVITVLGKRGDKWLEKLVDNYLKETDESSGAHVSTDSESSESGSASSESGSASSKSGSASSGSASYESGSALSGSASSGSASSGSGSASSESGSAPSELDHGSTDVVQALASNPHSSEQYFKTWKPPILDSSDIHASSSSTPPGTDHGSTNVVQAPASNPAPSIANPNPLTESSGPSAVAPMQGS